MNNESALISDREFTRRKKKPGGFPNNLSGVVLVIVVPLLPVADLWSDSALQDDDSLSVGD